MGDDLPVTFNMSVFHILHKETVQSFKWLIFPAQWKSVSQTHETCENLL